MLLSSTRPGWFQIARRDLGALLSDHLHCERKAAENALSLVRRYPAPSSSVDRLTRLAHEETSHVVQVAALIEERGLRLRADAPNRYARALLAEVRGREPERRIDLMLCAALIEARSHERLTLLADGFSAEGDIRLAGFYGALAAAEERHAETYVDLARSGAEGDQAERRWEDLRSREAEIVAGLPFACRVH